MNSMRIVSIGGGPAELHPVRAPARARRRWGVHPVLALVLLCTGPNPSARDSERTPRPNVLILLTDDQAFGTLSCQDHPYVETPSIDRIFSEGASFRNAFVTTSLCSPSRASFFSGQWVRRHEVVTNSQSLPERLVTFATVLSGEGYETAYFGKWHMGAQPQPYPGFSRAFSYVGQGVHRDPEFHRDGAPVRLKGFTDELAAEALIAFLREERESPFLAMLGFKSPHGPLKPPERFGDLFAAIDPAPPPNHDSHPPFPHREEWLRLAGDEGVDPQDLELPENWAGEFGQRETNWSDRSRRQLRRYWRLITSVDENVGRILGALDELGLAADTIVVYASDNGYAYGEHGMTGKRSSYEESMRIPFGLRYPRAVRPVEIHELVLNVDLAPTLLELCGAPPQPSIQGRSLVPLLTGESVHWREEFLYEYFRESLFMRDSPYYSYATPTMIALRTRTAKLVTYPEYPSWSQFFDLLQDPLERSDLLAGAELSPELAATIAELEARLALTEEELGPWPDVRSPSHSGRKPAGRESGD